MSKKKKQFVVTQGCDTADGVRYEVGDEYDPKDHSKETTAAFLEMECIKEAE